MNGLYLLWWIQERHLPVAAVATALAAGELLLTALEVPTGWLADRYGHRLSPLAGSILQVAAMLWCWFAPGIPGLLAATLIVALGDAFRSGADQGLLYRTCVALGREASFQQVEARTRALAQAALVGQVLAGGAIVQRWGFSAGWFVSKPSSLPQGCVSPGDWSNRAPALARVDGKRLRQGSHHGCDPVRGFLSHR